MPSLNPKLQPSPKHAQAPHVLIAAHLEMARRIALRVAQRVPVWMSRDDLVACAMVGLTEAASRYDASRDEPFPGFAEKRIRGAVLDELRRGDIMTRRGRREARQARKISEELEQSLGRAPEQAEIAAALGLTTEQHLEEQADLTPCTLVELSPALAAHLAGADEATPERMIREERTSQLAAALASLPERDARLLSLYYLEDLTYAEIGVILGVTESRVCQLHTRACARLKQLCSADLA